MDSSKDKFPFNRRRRQPKSPDQSQVTKPLMADLAGGGVGASIVTGNGGGSAHGTLNSSTGAGLHGTLGAGGGMGNGPSDPVEMRRINFQTPAMMNHPPITVLQLADHIDLLKSNDNQKFAQEYEV